MILCYVLQDEEAELARALQLSVAPNPPSAFSDANFAASLLSSADLSDPLVQAALAQLNANQPPPPPGSDKDGSKDETGKKRKGDDA